jgi:tetratricopeptide (TPR) repeat protein
MKDAGGSMYFDVIEYEELIDSFFEAEDVENIEYALGVALAQHPDNYEFLLKKAQLHAINGEDEKGLQLLEKLKGFGSDPDYFMIKGSLLSNLQKYTEAIEEYTKALNEGQDLEDVYTNIAFEYENLEQFDKAIEYLNKVVEINPLNESAINEIGICFEMGNMSENSVKYFNKFLDKNPYSRSAWFNLAIAFNSLGENNKAIDAYEFSLAIDDDQPSAYFNIANIYAGMENHPKAIDYYRETLLKESPDAITYYFLGESYERMDRFDDALDAFQNSYHINENFHEALLGISRCHFSIGNLEKAYEFIDNAIKLEEPFPLFWSIRCLKLQEMGFYQLAEMALFKLTESFPNEITYRLTLAVLIHYNRLNDALEILDGILTQFSEPHEQALTLFIKSLYLYQNGQHKESAACFKNAVKLNKEEYYNPLVQSEFNIAQYPGLMKLVKKFDL